MESLNLTPAESLIIISPKSSGNEMIKITLMDLVLKKVLNIDVQDSESKFLKNHYKAIILCEGDLSGTDLKPHEQILVDLIREHSQLELKEFVRLMHVRVNSTEYKSKFLMNYLIDKGYFKRQRKMLLSLIPHTSYVLTDKGMEIRNKIVKLLDDAKYLDKWMREDLGKAKAYLSVTGTHILLSNIYELEDIKKFNRILSQIEPESKVSDYFSYYLYAVPIGYLDGDFNSFNFIDISVLDNINSWNDFYDDFDSESVDAGDGRDAGAVE